MSLRAIFLVSIVLSATAALADDTHYQDQIVGEDALGMGGAFTAVADDASAAFYNPAGLAQIRSGSLSGSLSVYGYEHRRIENGLQTPLGHAHLEHEDYPTRGIGGGVVKRFGRRGPDRQRPFAFAMSTYIPFQSSFTYSNHFRVADPFGDGLIEFADETIRITEEDKTIWVGPSIAWRQSARFSLGLSAFLSTRSLDHSYDRSRSDVITSFPDGADDAEYANIITRNLSLTATTVILRFGVLYIPTDQLRLGLMLAAPSIPVTDSASLSNRSLIATLGGGITYDRSSDSKLETNAALPANARLGVAYLFSETALVAIDGSVYLPLSYDSDDPFVTEGSLAVDNFFVPTFERQLTWNVNVGFETLLASRVPFRVGGFTNLSSAPEPVAGNVAMQPDVDMFGASFAVGYRDEGYDISIGAAGMIGHGQALAYAGDIAVAGPDDGSFELVDYDQTAVYLYLAGAKKAAGRAVRDFMKPGE